MKCNQCGAEVPAQAAFCPQCGAQVGGAGAAASGTPAASERLRASAQPAPAVNEPEQELWSGAYSPKAMTGAFIGAGLLTILGVVAASYDGPYGWAACVIGAIILFGYLGSSLLYQRSAVRYRLTTQRLLRELGVLSRTDDRILVIEIDDITVRQGVFERMFNVGTIVLNTRDEVNPVLAMKGIENPRHVADLIDEARRSERNRRGLYTVNA